MGIRERIYLIIFVYYANIKVFHFIIFSLFFIYLDVSFLLACFLSTSALYNPITIFFCINKRFRIFDMFLQYLHVLDVNKNKFFCNI